MQRVEAGTPLRAEQFEIVLMLCAMRSIMYETVAPTTGSRLRSTDMGVLAKRFGLSHKNTKAYASCIRLGFLRKPPGRDHSHGTGHLVEAVITESLFFLPSDVFCLSFIQSSLGWLPLLVHW